MINMNYTSANASASSDSNTVTIERMMEALEKLEKSISTAPPALRESVNAVQITPNRIHKKKAHHTAAYHARIQKKWNKRYGKNSKPVAWMIDNEVFGMPGETILVNPMIYSELKNNAMIKSRLFNSSALCSNNLLNGCMS